VRVRERWKVIERESWRVRSRCVRAL
jgi:hypothetical protein